MAGRQDWNLVAHAIKHGYTLVTNNRADFTGLLRERHHPGLICINVAHGRDSLHVQQTLFAHALTEIDAEHLPGHVFDVTLDEDDTVRITRTPAA